MLPRESEVENAKEKSLKEENFNLIQTNLKLQAEALFLSSRSAKQVERLKRRIEQLSLQLAEAKNALLEPVQQPQLNEILLQAKSEIAEKNHIIQEVQGNLSHLKSEYQVVRGRLNWYEMNFDLIQKKNTKLEAMLAAKDTTSRKAVSALAHMADTPRARTWRESLMTNWPYLLGGGMVFGGLIGSLIGVGIMTGLTILTGGATFIVGGCVLGASLCGLGFGITLPIYAANKEANIAKMTHEMEEFTRAPQEVNFNNNPTYHVPHPVPAKRGSIIDSSIFVQPKAPLAKEKERALETPTQSPRKI